jgi:hypothetical protein
MNNDFGFLLSLLQQKPIIAQEVVNQVRQEIDKERIPTLLKKLIKDQEECELRLLTERQKILNKIKLKQSEIEADEIVGGKRLLQTETEMKSLSLELLKHDKFMHEYMQKLVKSQQSILQAESLPVKVTNDREDIKKQLLFLEPYL